MADIIYFGTNGESGHYPMGIDKTLSNDEYISAWDSPIRDCRISEVYRMTGEQIREYFNL